MDSTFKAASSIKHTDKKWPVGGATEHLKRCNLILLSDFNKWGMFGLNIYSSI